MNQTLLAIAMVLATSQACAATTVKATVNGMVCAFCAQGIEKRIAAMPATKAVFVDLKRKTVAVEARDGLTLDQTAIRTEIVNAGYDVVRMETLPESVDEIRTEMKARK
jgi:mercuric ion binding protein